MVSQVASAALATSIPGRRPIADGSSLERAQALLAAGPVGAATADFASVRAIEPIEPVAPRPAKPDQRAQLRRPQLDDDEAAGRPSSEPQSAALRRRGGDLVGFLAQAFAQAIIPQAAANSQSSAEGFSQADSNAFAAAAQAYQARSLPEPERDADLVEIISASAPPAFGRAIDLVA